MRQAALESKAWPFEAARRLLRRVEADPGREYVLFETGYGPSGLPHIGTFGEVARTAMVRRAFEEICDIPTRLICFSDDMDGMRKIPENIPARGLTEHLQKPLADVPDPYGEHASFAARNNARLRAFLDRFGFDYEFVSACEFYRSGRFDETLLRVAERHDQIMEVMLESLGEERRQTYSCFLPISPATGRILYVPMKHVDAKNGTVVFDDEDGTERTLPVTGGGVKLQWKPDFGARWAALGVDFEMFGKEHATNAPIYDRICGILGGRAPEHFVYELFLDGEGRKISKSLGNGLPIEDWLTYAGPESLGFFMFQKPNAAKRLHWGAIPRAVDEYHRHLAAYPEQDAQARLANPVWHIHGGAPPASDLPIPFSMLLNLAAAASVEDKQTLWGFIRRYAPDAGPITHPGLDAAAGWAVRYVRDVVKPARTHRAPVERERAALTDLRDRLRALAKDAGAGANGANAAEALQDVVLAVGKDHGFDPLRDWFKAMYEVLLGADHGPRLGGFIALYGVEETAALIDKALAGDLAPARLDIPAA